MASQHLPEISRHASTYFSVSPLAPAFRKMVTLPQKFIYLAWKITKSRHRNYYDNGKSRNARRHSRELGEIYSVRKFELHQPGRPNYWLIQLSMSDNMKCTSCLSCNKNDSSSLPVTRLFRMQLLADRPYKNRAHILPS